MSSQPALLRILQPGACTLLQDLGRKGGQAVGFSEGGAMDEQAFLWANALLDNHPSRAALEITLGGFSCEFLAATQIAVCGAAESFWLNDQLERGWQSCRVKAGDILRIPVAKTGLRTYLAVTGGFAAEALFGSATMVMREKSGPFGGLPLARNQMLDGQPSRPRPPTFRRCVPARFIPDYRRDLELEIFVSAQADADAIHTLLTSEFSVNEKSNRMACLLDGAPLPAASQTLYSFGTALGAIQLPPDGKPIILLRERQTIGGYPQIGCVSRLDCNRLGQARAQQKLRFALGDIAAARRELAGFYAFFSSRRLGY